MSSRGPSNHLSWPELACRAGAPYPAKWRGSRARILAVEFERLRELAGGKPIPIGSAYRTESHNRRVGGARKSQHVQGRALDLLVSGVRRAILEAALFDRLEEPGCRIRGVGYYPWGIHIDVRPGKRLARWGGSRPAAELA